MAASTDGREAPFVSVGVGATDLDRYGAIRLDSGAVVVYDADHEDAWLQCSFGIDVTAMR